jgi:hypothetical protein
MSHSPSASLDDSASKRKRTKAWTPQEDQLVQDLVRQHGGADEEIAAGGGNTQNIKCQ